MKVFIDILTPKQCMLFAKVSECLRREGHQVFAATRKYREVNELLEIKGIEAHVAGKHGGAGLKDKLEASAQRTLELTSIVDKLHPNVAVSFSSPETARVAFGLHIPHVCLNDSPHSELVARLTVPLSNLLLTPKLIPKTAWTKFGITADRIIQYNAIDPWAWLKDFKQDTKILKHLDLTDSRPVVLFRTEESFASYLLTGTSKELAWASLLEDLLKSKVDFQAVILPRYENQIDLLNEKFGKRAKVCRSIIDAPSLLTYASIFIGAGGTMTAEAALLGTPTFSCYPGKPFLIENFLIRNGLVVRETDCKKLRKRVLKTLNNVESARKTQKAKAKKLTDSFEDPTQVIVAAIKKVS